MGTTRVTVAIRNPAEPERVWEGLFLVLSQIKNGRGRVGGVSFGRPWQ